LPGYDNRLKPIGVLPQDVDAAVAEMYRCVNELGMIGIAVAPNIPTLILKRLRLSLMSAVVRRLAILTLNHCYKLP